MSSKTEARRSATREKLIDVAETMIASGGLHSLKARDVAKETGIAVGGIYSYFPDMQALVMAVNARTFRRVGCAVTQALENHGPGTPHARLIVMSHAYLRFAADNQPLWRALFDLDMSTDGPVPDWYQEELSAVFALIAGPVSEIYPSKTPQELDLTVRALFSAVHGIVLLGLERRLSAVPLDKLESMISELLGRVS
jgi:AcrR family transcriptional regulator